MKIKRLDKILAVDTETTGLRPWHGDGPFAFSTCNPSAQTFFNRFAVDPFTRKISYGGPAFDWWKGMLEDASITKVFHNAKFDVRMFDSIGIKVAGRIEDTMFALHVLNNLEPSLALKKVSKKYLEFPDDDEKELHRATVRARREAKKLGWKIAGKSASSKDPVRADYWLAPHPILKKYAVCDAERTIQLWLLLENLLEEEKLRHVYDEEMALWPVTYRMETRGIRVFPDVIAREIKANFKRTKELGIEIERVKPGLNVDSPQQMVNFVYKELGNPIIHFTNKGFPSVDGDALAAIDHPIVKTIAEFKAAEKANTNFFFKYRSAMVEEQPGIWILHPDFNQIGPVTGRYSCRNPNIQNVANALTTRSSVPIQARTPFSPRPGWRWYHFDFSQIEMWIFAALAKEHRMLDALFAGRDLHGETAELIWGKGIVAREAAEGKKTARAKAKMMNFGIIYGIGAQSLSGLTKTTVAQAKEDLDGYKRAFPNIATYMDKLVREAESRGYVEGPMGRRWRVYPDRAYVATNYMVQGSAAQVIKAVMVKVDDYFRGKPAHLIATIHDEHIDEIKAGYDTIGFIKSIQRLSENHGHPFGLPRLPVEVARTVTCWKEKQEVDFEVAA